jgi:hypothetical protein
MGATSKPLPDGHFVRSNDNAIAMPRRSCSAGDRSSSPGRRDAGAQAGPDIDVFFPRGYGMAVNQVGYMEGNSLEHEDGPWRAGIRRSFDVRDYRPIVEVGRAVGVRFMSLFALAEMDRLNVVATLPHATQAGHAFDNSAEHRPASAGDHGLRARECRSHRTRRVTGVGHEWWVDGVKTRSEWYDLTNQRPRDEAMMRRHMDVIDNILGPVPPLAALRALVSTVVQCARLLLESGRRLQQWQASSGLRRPLRQHEVQHHSRAESSAGVHGRLRPRRSGNGPRGVRKSLARIRRRPV